MTSYDVIEYWNKRDNPNSKNPNERNTLKHISFVKENIRLNDKILDYGPGIGRILPAYSENNKITGYDVSSKYKERLLETARQKKIELDLIIDKAILTEFSFNNDEFNVVVSISVLLHQPPKDIVNIMCELARVATKVVIVSWHNPTIPYDSADEKPDNSKFCFNHDYKEICKENNLKIDSWQYDSEAKQIYFVYRHD